MTMYAILKHHNLSVTSIVFPILFLEPQDKVDATPLELCKNLNIPGIEEVENVGGLVIGLDNYIEESVTPPLSSDPDTSTKKQSVKCKCENNSY